jgi:predicted MFS family arabinose efflux permease
MMARAAISFEGKALGDAVSEERTPKGAWGITALLFSFMLINFADKTVVGLAAVPIMRDLDLTPRQFGFLGSSFSFLFAVSGILVGFVANRIATRWVLLALAFAWAVVQFPMVGAAGFATLVACRVLLGAGEGPAFSVAVHALYKWFPDQQRTLPTAVLTQGAAVGVIIALPALNWIIVRYSWHWAFFALGAVGLLWVLIWALLGREGPVAAPAPAAADAAAREHVPYTRLLLNPTFIGCCLACFGGTWAIALGLTWFTPFIITGLGHSQQQAGWISALPWLMGATVVLTTGFLSQALTARGASPRWARGVVGSTPLVVGGLILLIVPHLADSTWQIVLVVIGGGLCGSIFVVCPPIISSFTPVTQRAALIAIFVAIYTSAGIFAPIVTGNVIETAATALEGYYTGYSITGVVQLLGGLAGLLLLWPTAQDAQETLDLFDARRVTR